MKLDPRIEFYMKHQEQIDEWAKLRDLACREADKFFISLFHALETAKPQFPGVPEFEANFDSHWPAASLWRPGWEEVDEGKVANWIGVCIHFEWVKSKSLFDGLYGGVRCHRDNPGATVLRSSLKEHLASGGFKENKWWAGYRTIMEPKEDYFLDLDGFRSDLINEMESVWRTFYPLIDEVVKKLKRKR